MFLKVNDAIKGLKLLPTVYKALYENIVSQYKAVKLYLSNYKYNLTISRYLGCKTSTISSYYKHIGYFHLEVLAHNGIFMYKSHRIDDIYPNITVLDTNKQSFQNLELLLEKTLCKLTYINLDINKESIDLSVKFNSIALPFVLERLEGGLPAIDNFLNNLKTQLDPYKAIIYGVTVPAKGLTHNKNYNKYLELLKKQNIFFNSEVSVEDLFELFNKHFNNVNLYQEGSCLFFVLEPEIQKLKLKPILPKSDPLIMPYV